MADRQTALAVFDFLDSLRAGQYRIGADAEKDHATAGLLASLSGDTGLRDAVCAKLISPGLERARFLMVAEHDPRALPLFASGQVKPWYQADYNVREIANSEFHQDIPALLWRLSNTIPDSAPVALRYGRNGCGGCPTPSRIPREGRARLRPPRT